jgi:hypothetical protein
MHIRLSEPAEFFCEKHCETCNVVESVAVRRGGEGTLQTHDRRPGDRGSAQRVRPQNSRVYERYR